MLLSRGALDRLCPPGAECLGSDGRPSGGATGCGHLWLQLLTQAAPALGISTFFVPVGWGLQIHRPHGGLHAWKANGGHALSRADSPLGKPFDLTAGVRCAFGRDARNESACSPRSARTAPGHRGGAATRSADLNYNGRVYVCDQVTDL